MPSLSISITDHASPRLQQLITGLSDRSSLNLAVGKSAQNCIRDHLIALAATRHDTANALGAKPSGHLAKAAEKVGLANALRDIGDGVQISLNHPGLSRAFKDIAIVPGPGKKYLTLPAGAEAYNKRAYRFNNLQVLYGKKGPYALAERPHTELTWRKIKRMDSSGAFSTHKISQAGAQHPGGKIFYWLVKSVSQPQDRTLLPTDTDITAAALNGARDYLDLLLIARSPSPLSPNPNP